MRMRISDLARAGGVGVETIRFYQRKGLLGVPRGDARGNRHYDQADLDRLCFVRKAQRAGFTLAQIAELLALDRSEDRCAIRAIASERIADLDHRIAELREMRLRLGSLVDECASQPAGPCPIVGAFAG